MLHVKFSRNFKQYLFQVVNIKVTMSAMSVTIFVINDNENINLYSEHMIERFQDTDSVKVKNMLSNLVVFIFRNNNLISLKIQILTNLQNYQVIYYLTCSCP